MDIRACASQSLASQDEFSKLADEFRDALKCYVNAPSAEYQRFLQSLRDAALDDAVEGLMIERPESQS
jgi:hypothetical protein